MSFCRLLNGIFTVGYSFDWIDDEDDDWEHAVIPQQTCTSRSYLHDRHSRMVPHLRASASSTMYVQEEGRHEDPKKAETQQTAKAGKK